jgi:hypothetical protein
MNRFFATAALLTGLFATADAQTAAPTSASPEQMKLDSLTKVVQHYINENQPDSLYALMGTDFKKQISADQMKQVTAQLNGLGKWTKAEQAGMKDTVAKYKATFPVATLDFYIGRDATGKISTLGFKPAE